MTAPAPHIYQFSQNPDEDFAIKQRMKETYERSIAMNQAFWAEADINTRFKAGDQSLYSEIYGQIPAFRRQLLSLNRIPRITNLISGNQRANRKSMIVIPVESADQTAADQFTKVLMWCVEREGMLPTISEAFEGAITAGMNLLSLWIDFQSDPINGNLKLDNVSYNGYLIDPFFKNPDLSDCEFVWTRKWVTRAQAKALLPFRKKQIDELTPGTSDGKFQFMPQALLQGYENHYLAYDEYWYKTTRKQRLLVDMQSGQTLEWRGTKTDLDFFLQTHQNIEVVTNYIPTCKLAIVVQDRVLYHGKNPMGIDSYPFVPIFAYRDPSLTNYALRCRSVVSGLRSAQSLYDHRKRVELDILESQVSSGFKFKENSLLNPKDVFTFGQGRGIALKQEANMEDVQAIQPPDLPPGMMQLSQQLATEIQEISGVNEELLGTAEDDRGVGLVSQLRQGAGLTTLRTLFDQLDHAQKILGKICVDMIQNNFSAGKVERIIGQQPVAQFFNRDFGKFDISIEDGLNTSTQKQIYFRQLLELKQMGIPIPNQTLIKSSTLQNKKELVEDIAQEEQRAMAIQKQKSDLEDEKSRAEIKSLIGMGQAQAGLAIERGARTQENRAMALERLSSSEKEKETALLNRIKAIKELESIDLEKLKKLIEITDMVKSKETINEEKDRLQVVSPNPEEVAALTGTPESLVSRENVKKDLYQEKSKKKLPLETINEKPKEVTDGL